ncbi:hypothetical protein ACX51_12615 [Lacticaseibacillus paracasei]|uniref:Uncharacterized protein n=1 Tax=Lacticaseibacillus paracasei TaxID=1597 RepID=A0ABD6VY12_LACPA|nr:hypothetical protein ACX51_12615 [Lacticaseibacillus paracasei]
MPDALPVTGTRGRHAPWTADRAEAGDQRRSAEVPGRVCPAAMGGATGGRRPARGRGVPVGAAVAGTRGSDALQPVG